MIKPRLKVMLAERGIRQATLAESVPEMSKVLMSYIANGAAMPTKETMKAICAALGCQPTDIYPADQLDLSLTAEKTAQSEEHQEIGPFSRWLTKEESDALEQAIGCLGYSGTKEWIREMYRQTVKQYGVLQLDGRALHELVPPGAVQATQE